MNNKGFGLQEVLVFIGLFMFILVAATIYGKAKFQNPSSSNNQVNNISTYNSLDELTPVNIEKTNNKYIELEEKIVNATKKYEFDKNNDTIISLEKLKQYNLIYNFVDPNNNINCDGYVIYKTSDNSFNPYIRCEGMYTTNNFNEELLK